MSSPQHVPRNVWSGDAKTLLGNSQSDFCLFDSNTYVMMCLIFEIMFKWQKTNDKGPMDNQKLTILILNPQYLQNKRLETFEVKLQCQLKQKSRKLSGENKQPKRLAIFLNISNSKYREIRYKNEQATTGVHGRLKNYRYLVLIQKGSKQFSQVSCL